MMTLQHYLFQARDGRGDGDGATRYLRRRPEGREGGWDAGARAIAQGAASGRIVSKSKSYSERALPRKGW